MFRNLLQKTQKFIRKNRFHYQKDGRNKIISATSDETKNLNYYYLKNFYLHTLHLNKILAFCHQVLTIDFS